eukprot:4309397-Lingulodinium_polyedra.AAC.1
MLKVYFLDEIDQRRKVAVLRAARTALSSVELHVRGREPYVVLEPPACRKPLRANAARFFAAMQRRGVGTKATVRIQWGSMQSEAPLEMYGTPADGGRPFLLGRFGLMKGWCLQIGNLERLVGREVREDEFTAELR